MTKQLAPIEELAKNITSLEVCNGIVYFSTEVPIENGEYKSELVEVTGLIKELRQAIIRDFVSKQKAVAWKANDGSNRTVNLNQKDIMHKIVADVHSIPLFELSEWI